MASTTDVGARAAIHTTHAVEIQAPARTVYAIVADVTRWPYTFGPTVHAVVLESGATTERLRLWAFANGAVRTWISRRSLDVDALHVGFRQEVPASPVLAMGGEWRIEALSPDTTRVALLHDYTAASAGAEELIARAVEANSRAELTALKRAAEFGEDAGSAVVVSFEDSVDVDAPAGLVFDFLRDAAAWPRRLPHVARLELTEPEPDVQVMAMDTRAGDGSVHTTHSVRVCFPQDRSIVYKQTVTPEIMAAHVGRWTVTPQGTGVRATSQHTVVLRPEKLTDVLGPDATIEQARVLVRQALGANSSTTLRHAKAFAESGGVPAAAA